MAKSFLIDTNIFIWFSSDDSKLKRGIKQLLVNKENTILVSTVVAWEIVIKRAKGRLKTPPDLKKAIEIGGFEVFPVELDHVLTLAKLPNIHGDPFDRMLIAQAKAGKLTLITSDIKIWKYNIKLLRA